jgi:hypothetical protein
VSTDALLVSREGAAVDQLNLLDGWTSGTVKRSCGGTFSLAGSEGDTGLRFTWFFAVTPRGSCDTELTEICDGAAMLRAGDEVGEFWPDARELVSESRRMETFEEFFFVVSDLRLGE